MLSSEAILLNKDSYTKICKHFEFTSKELMNANSLQVTMGNTEETGLAS